MATNTHIELIAELHTAPELTWGGRALLACLSRLRDGGVTEWSSIAVLDAWAFKDGFCVVYRWPTGPRLGLRVAKSASSSFGPPLYYQNWLTSNGVEPTEQEFGSEIADLAIAEPMVSIDELVFDEHEVGWWGQEPFPLNGSSRDKVHSPDLTSGDVEKAKERK